MMYQYTLRAICWLYTLVLKISTLIGRRKRDKRRRLEILITGTFYSDNWLITHLKPLAMSDEVAVVRMVSVRKVPDMDKVVGFYPPERLCKLIGGVPARLLYFCWVGIKTKPDIVGGFHLLLNGLAAILLANIIRSRSLYICGGGPREVAGGGIETESKIFNRLTEPDLVIEGYLLKAVNHCDLVIVMGHGAEQYFRSRGIDSRIEIVPGGFDSSTFQPRNTEKQYDLILVGRLSKVKRVDIFLESLARLAIMKPDLRAVIVGDGPDTELLKELSRNLKIDSSVDFAGWRDDVDVWLAKTRVFTLTSESEGLSQALIQAMMMALPAVVTDIGDLSDLVHDNVNGYLIDSLDPEKFSNAYMNLLSDPQRYTTASQMAFSDTRKFSYERVAEHWNSILSAAW